MLRMLPITENSISIKYDFFSQLLNNIVTIASVAGSIVCGREGKTQRLSFICAAAMSGVSRDIPLSASLLVFA